MRRVFPILALLCVVSCVGKSPTDIPARQEVTYRFTWDGADYKGQPTFKMEPGKYYVLHPDAVTELDGLFSLEFAEWTCGME